MSHTEGKLSYQHRKRKDGMYSTEIFDEDGETVFTAAWYPVKTEDGGTVTNREANARRLVACWNFWIGASTKMIEEGNALYKYPGLEIVDEMGKAKQERDEALDMLRDTQALLRHKQWSPDMLVLLGEIDYVLAKHKGEA